MIDSESTVFWLPETSNDCKEPPAIEESFSSLKFLAFVLTVYNLVSIVTSTSNNNLNNNNLNSNDFSGNVNFSGDTNSNADVNMLNMVIPPGRRRKRRDLSQNLMANMIGFSTFWFKMLAEKNPLCQKNMICQFNKRLIMTSASKSLTSVIAEVFSFALVLNLPMKPEYGPDFARHKIALIEAGSDGRIGLPCYGCI